MMQNVIRAVELSYHRPPHHFDIAQGSDGLWHVEDREALVGGIFRTQKDALRFALFETDGDSACVHLRNVGAPLANEAKRAA